MNKNDGNKKSNFITSIGAIGFAIAITIIAIIAINIFIPKSHAQSVKFDKLAAHKLNKLSFKPVKSVSEKPVQAQWTKKEVAKVMKSEKVFDEFTAQQKDQGEFVFESGDKPSLVAELKFKETGKTPGDKPVAAFDKLGFKDSLYFEKAG